MRQELSWDGYQIDDWRSLIDANPSLTESEPIRVELQARELDVKMVNHARPSQSIDVDLDSALRDRGGQGDDQHDDKNCAKEYASPSRVRIHGYYCDWERPLLFNNQQAMALEP